MAQNLEFEKLLEDWKKIHNLKNEDYAKTGDPYYNLRGCEDMGIPAWKGVIVRMTDKMSRLKNLARDPNGARNEPIEDTFDDMGIYSALGKLLYKEWKKNE